MPMRPLSRIRSVSTKPLPSWPSRFAERHAAVLEHQLGGVRRAHAELVLLAARSGSPGSRARRRSPRCPSCPPRGRSPSSPRPCPRCAPLVMKFFEPFSTQCWPSRTAVVRMPPASEPEPGSVRPQQPTFSPRASGGRNVASAPRCRPGGCGRSTGRGAPRATARRPRPRAPAPPSRSPSRASRAPEPPYSSGQQAPATPSAPSRAKISRGNSCFSSHSRECGASSALGELAHGLAQQLLLFAQLEVHIASACGIRLARRLMVYRRRHETAPAPAPAPARPGDARGPRACSGSGCGRACPRAPRCGRSRSGTPARRG